MVKKAKLDILEIAPDEPDGETKQGEASAEEGGENGSIREKPGRDYPAKAIEWVRKPLFWIILMSVVCLGSVAGILIGFYQSMDGDIPTVQKKQAVSAIPFPQAKRSAIFDGIVVDQKDEHGNVRIVFCDVAIELENREMASAVNGDRIDVRSVIHTVLKKVEAKEGLSPEGRGRLKEKLKNELNGLFGENLVKDVYFTSYELD
jgi:flagellar basal body-associated protein FliL